ncbi:clathrin adaptor complex small chain [Necator americanus]|uniref:Clathrin adaptor complex small chain n=1 Tax=Necator americanus TaxID=51031 RepID=W2TV51_NECAM|nr:clathrin adaptor complex small chain [Necator americanus]ETN85524.1 clathrin adaptor complex small chain [Necator americanus]
MIKAILVINNHGKPRLLKFYQYYTEEMQQQIVRETFQLVSKRDDNVCNFLEGGTLIDGNDYRLIYRHYATLYFIFCVDSSESELGILDLIQVFVETLDRCFENVCELDLIFHVDKVHHILGEIVMGGMVLETNMNEILLRIQEQEKLQKAEAGIAAAPARAVSAVKKRNYGVISPVVHTGRFSHPDLRYWDAGVPFFSETTPFSSFIEQGSGFDDLAQQCETTEIALNDISQGIRVTFPCLQ